MHVTDKHIASFKTLYACHFGRTLTSEEALQKATSLVSLVETILRRNAQTRTTLEAIKK